MKRWAFFLYGAVSYAAFLVAILYAIGFVGGFAVPKDIDAGPVLGSAEAITLNVLLLAAFAVQHTIMARPTFKKWWTRLIPEPIERSTFVLLASLLLLLTFWQWRPLPSVVWHVENAAANNALAAASLFGWALVFYSTFLIDHFDLFGMRQVFLYLRGVEYTPSPFAMPWLYRLIRHPLMLGFVIAFWAAPTMSQGRLLFAAVTTCYILIGIQFEERSLLSLLGDDYRRYRKRTPMIIPWPRRAASPAQAGEVV